MLPSVSSVFPQWYQWFDPAGLAKFDEMVQRGELEVVCENERIETLTYRRKKGGKCDEAKTH